MSNLRRAPDGFAYQSLRFRWLAAVERRPKDSYRDIGHRPDIARLFKDPGRFSGGRLTEIQLTGFVASIHFLLSGKTNDAEGQFIFGNFVQFLEKLKTPIDFTSRAGAIGLHCQQTASDGGRGILGVSSGAIDDRTHVLQSPGPHEENRERGAGLNEPHLIAQRVEDIERALILLN